MMYPQAISHGNILTFTPPGFHQALNVKFPDSRLAVCKGCKKNYKTRDMCRVRNSHTSPPWATAFICVTFDDTCIEDGKFIDKPMTVRMLQWQPFCVRKPFDVKHPVCSSCKKTNRTRNFCRERHKHRQLPWCTVYVLLSALESTDPSTVVADPSQPVVNEKEEGEEEEKESSKKEATSEPAPKEQEALAADAGVDEKADANSEPVGVIDNNFEDTDDINDINENRTFLAKVSCHGMSIHWLDLAEFDPQDTAYGFAPPLDVLRGANASGGPPQGDQAQFYPYAQAMSYSVQQQQPMKNQQQYFYQMQRQGQPNYGQQAAGWPPPNYGQQVTAGEAAAQQQKQQEGDQWQMMYPPPHMYHAQSDAPADLGGNDIEPAPVMTGDEEGHDAKRVRMV